jgi:hypothetical protein
VSTDTIAPIAASPAPCLPEEPDAGNQHQQASLFLNTLALAVKTDIPDRILHDVAVRRDAHGGLWIIPDLARESFEDSFRAGLMLGVKLNGSAPMMTCSGNKSYGEAQGDETFVLDGSERDFEMPSEATYTGSLRYRPSLGFVIGCADYVVTSCDFLLLKQDGTAAFGWIEKPVGAPQMGLR